MASSSYMRIWLWVRHLAEKDILFSAFQGNGLSACCPALAGQGPSSRGHEKSPITSMPRILKKVVLPWLAACPWTVLHDLRIQFVECWQSKIQQGLQDTSVHKMATLYKVLSKKRRHQFTSKPSGFDALFFSMFCALPT